MLNQYDFHFISSNNVIGGLVQTFMANIAPMHVLYCLCRFPTIKKSTIIQYSYTVCVCVCIMYSYTICMCIIEIFEDISKKNLYSSTHQISVSACLSTKLLSSLIDFPSCFHGGIQLLTNVSN